MIKYLKISALILVAVGIGVYVFFQGYDLIRGPVLEVHMPTNGASFEEPLVEITGLAKNISFIYLNNNQIFVDSKGNFSQKLLLLPGYNIITLRATDKFGREVRQELHLILEENNYASQEES